MGETRIGRSGGLRALWVALALLTLGASPARAITFIDHCPFTLDKPGETYILARNLSCDDAHLKTIPDVSFAGTLISMHAALHIAANGVTLLLNGRSIAGDNPSVLLPTGILVTNDAQGVRILGPGSVTGFQMGIFFEDGAQRHSISSVRADANQNGIFFANNNRYNSLTANQVSGSTSFGIYFQDNNRYNQLTGNRVYDSGISGIVFGSNNAYNQLTGNWAYNNGSSGINFFQGNTGNQLTGNWAYGNGFTGIQFDVDNRNNRLIGNHADENEGWGIIFFEDGNTGNRVEFNTANGNSGLDGYGIYVALGSTGNTFQFNQALGNNILDLRDANENCSSNLWRFNVFNTAEPDCIR